MCYYTGYSLVTTLWIWTHANKSLVVAAHSIIRTSHFFLLIFWLYHSALKYTQIKLHTYYYYLILTPIVINQSKNSYIYSWGSWVYTHFVRFVLFPFYSFFMSFTVRLFVRHIQYPYVHIYDVSLCVLFSQVLINITQTLIQ